jgi:glycosyltransferase involved in cell wall biosynthesis
MTSPPSVPSASVILSVFDNLAAVVRSLLGYEIQSRDDFEIIITDDGTDPGQQGPLRDYLSGTPLNVRQLWQEDLGFRKCRAQNRGIAVARAKYLIFVDGDIIPRRDYVEMHLARAKPKFFVAGGSNLDLPEEVARQLTPDDIRSNRCFDLEWLKSRGVESAKFRDRLGTPRWLIPVKDFFTQRRNAFLGGNGSCWKEDAISVNGFDEELGYGAEDRDFGCRLTNAGVRSQRYRYSFVGLHQSHPRPYRNPEIVNANKALSRERRRSGVTWVERGLSAHLQGEGPE